MSRRRCPKPRLENYKIGTSFNGHICSLYCAEKGLVYILDEKKLESFREIESSNPAHEYTKPPGFGEIFIYRYANQMCYRAYRLRSNPADFSCIRAFLFDIGIEIYQNFKPKRFFKIPVQFAVNSPMGLFCYVQSIPTDYNEGPSTFLKESLHKYLKFNILMEKRLGNALGENRRCLEVVIEEPEEVTEKVSEIGAFEREPTDDEETDDDVAPYKDSYEEFKSEIDQTPGQFPRLTYPGGEASGKDFNSELDELELPVDPLPTNGSKILVFVMEIISPTSMYARLMNQSEITKRKFEDSKASSQLVVWMNDEDVVRSYQRLTREPLVDDLVVAIGRDYLYHRGRVASKSNGEFTIFFIDFGYTLNISFEHLWMFPREFTCDPAQAAHIQLSNTVTLENKPNQLEIIETLKSLLQPFGVAQVNSSSFDNNQMQLSVQMYEANGNNILNAAAMRMTGLNESVYDTSDFDFD